MQTMIRTGDVNLVSRNLDVLCPSGDKAFGGVTAVFGALIGATFGDLILGLSCVVPKYGVG